MHRVTECKASPDYKLWLNAVDRTAATVVWDGGIQFDRDILYQDLLSSTAGKEFNPPGLAPEVE
jgi:hypothetical protein